MQFSGKSRKCWRPLLQGILDLPLRYFIRSVTLFFVLLSPHIYFFFHSFVRSLYSSLDLSFIRIFAHSFIHSISLGFLHSFIVRSFFVSYFFRYGSIIGYFHHIGFRGEKLEQFIKTISKT